MALTTTAGSLGALNAAVSVDVQQNSTFSGVVTGTFVGTVTLQALYDATEGWVSAQTFTRPGVSAAAALTAPGNRIINTGGAIAVRAAMTAYTSGTAVVTLAGTPAASGASSGGGGGGGAATIADGADVAQGTTTDAGIITDAPGTVIGFLRGFIKQSITLLARLPAALTGSGNFKVSVAESTASQAVTNANLDAPLSTLGTQTTLAAILAKIIAAPATEATLALIKTDVDKIPASPATDRTTAAAPAAVELSDGAAFYTGAKTGQLPAALVGGRIDVNLGAAPATVTTQGGAAVGAAAAGNPNLLGVVDGSGNMQNLKQVAASAATVTNGLGLAGVGLHVNNGGANWFPLVNGGSQGDANAANGSLDTAQRDWNGTTWDRHRNNVDVTLLASASRTTTQGPTTLTTYNAGAIVFVLDMTTVGTGSVTLTINEVDVASGKSILMLSGAAVTTNSTNVYTVDPILTAAANSIAKLRTPRTLSYTVTANNSNACTYSLGAMVELAS